MTGNEVEALGIVTTFIGGGTFILIGLKMFLNYRTARLGLGNPGGEEMKRLAETVEDLQRDLADTRAELADVHERVDFAERLLARARDAGQLGPGS